MDGKLKSNQLRSTCAQVVATLAFNTLMVHVGMIIGMPVIIIGALRTEKSTLTFTVEEASWFGGLIFMIQPLGSVVSGFLQDLLGRKACMMIVNIPQFIAWIIIFYSKSVSALFIAVFLLGISIGFMEAPVLSYIGEISEPRLRGVLSTLGGIFFNIGLIIEVSLGAVVDWRSMALISSVAPVIAFFSLAMVPDSPAWLVTKGRIEDARKAYQWLRGWVPAQVIQEELDALVTYVKQNRQPKIVKKAEYVAVINKNGIENRFSSQEVSESKLKIFLHPSVQRPLRLIVIYFFIGASASLCAMRPFFIEVLGRMNLHVQPHLVIVYGSILTFLGAITSTLTMPRVGKRGLTFLSLGLSVFCCFGLGFFLISDLHTAWIPLTLFAISYFAAPLGLIVIPWILISELFPLKGRGLAGGVAAALGYFIMFLLIKTFYNLVSLVNYSGVCFIYGTVGLLGLIYLYFQLPETEGVPLEEIESFFSNKKKNIMKKEGNPNEKGRLNTKEEDEV